MLGSICITPATMFLIIMIEITNTILTITILTITILLIITKIILNLNVGLSSQASGMKLP